MEHLGSLDFLALREILETAGARDHQAFWQLHLFHSKVLLGTLGSLAALARWGPLDHLASQVHQADLGKPVQA